MTKQILIFACCLLIHVVSFYRTYSQQGGEWISAQLELDLPKGFTGEFTGEFRTFHPGIQLGQFHTDFTLGYKINKRIDVAASYRYIRKREQSYYLYPRNRWYADLSYDNSFGRTTIQTRIRILTQNKTYWEEAEDKLPDRYIRERIKFAYNLPGTKIEPYLTAELFFPIIPASKGFDAYRITSGIDFPLKNKQSMDVGLMFEKEYLPRPATFINLLLSYEFELKL